MPMEERPPPSGETQPPPPGAKTAALAVDAAHATYVVQIPRDQVYRVPPPEHARIFENHHQGLKRRPKSSPCRIITCCVILPIMLLGLITACAWLALRATIYEPKPPDIAFSRVHGKNHGGGTKSPEYDVTLRATNKNKHMSTSYPTGGDASLVFKTHKIGNGKMVSKIPDGDVVDIPLVLSGNGYSLSAKVKESLSDAAEKTLAFNADLPMEMKSWARKEKLDIKISCDIKVHDLFNKTKISFQECVSKF